jgi:hypothetical protein
MKLSAAQSGVNVSISKFSTGILSDFNHSESRQVKARISECPTGFYENGTSSGNFYDVAYKAGSAVYTPWILVAGSKSFYNPTSYSACIANPTGVNRNMSTLTSGEATMPRGEVQSNVTLSSEH